jgi:hypothetical protein
MTTYVVTEGPVQGAMLKSLVRSHPLLRRRRIQVLETGGRKSAASKACSLLLMEREPAAVLLDTKTIEPRAIEERRYFAEWVLERGGAPEEWQLTLVVPEVTVLLFQNEEILRSLLPGPLSFEQRIVARYEPTRILTEVFAQAGKPFPATLIRRLARAELSPLWKLPILQPLERFLLSDPHVRRVGEPLESGG